jgi:hypothetical protein
MTHALLAPRTAFETPLCWMHARQHKKVVAKQARRDKHSKYTEAVHAKWTKACGDLHCHTQVHTS